MSRFPVAMGRARLLELPIELRMTIYNFAVPALTRPVLMVMGHLHMGQGRSAVRPGLADRQCEVALLHTNRQIRSDVAAMLVMRRVEIYCDWAELKGNYVDQAKMKLQGRLWSWHSWTFPPPPMCFKFHLTIRLHQRDREHVNYRVLFNRLDHLIQEYEIEEVETLNFLVHEGYYSDEDLDRQRLNGMNRFVKLGCILPRQVRVVMTPRVYDGISTTEPVPLSDDPVFRQVEKQVLETFEEAVRQLGILAVDMKLTLFQKTTRAKEFAQNEKRFAKKVKHLNEKEQQLAERERALAWREAALTEEAMRLVEGE